MTLSCQCNQLPLPFLGRRDVNARTGGHWTEHGHKASMKKVTDMVDMPERVVTDGWMEQNLLPTRLSAN